MNNTNKSDTYRSIGINNIKAPTTVKKTANSSVIKGGNKDLRSGDGKVK